MDGLWVFDGASRLSILGSWRLRGLPPQGIPSSSPSAAICFGTGPLGKGSRSKPRPCERQDEKLFQNNGYERCRRLPLHPLTESASGDIVVSGNLPKERLGVA